MFKTDYKGNSDVVRRDRVRRRMIGDAVQFLNRRLQHVPRRQDCSNEAVDRKSDPRYGPHGTPTGGKPMAKPVPVATNGGVFVEIHANERGHLDDELLVPLVSRLSRLISAPHRGNVLLDMSELKSVTDEFVRVYRWFQDQLRKQRREAVVLVNGQFIYDAEANELPRLEFAADQPTNQAS